MPNPLYQMLYGGAPQQRPSPNYQSSGGMNFQNPMQKMAYIMQAMTNPSAFVKQHFPDIPSDIQNDPRQILSYLQQTRGISDQQIREAQQAAGQIQGMGTVK